MHKFPHVMPISFYLSGRFVLDSDHFGNSILSHKIFIYKTLMSMVLKFFKKIKKESTSLGLKYSNLGSGLGFTNGARIFLFLLE